MKEIEQVMIDSQHDEYANREKSLVFERNS